MTSKYTLILIAVVIYVVWRQSKMAAAVTSSTGSAPAGVTYGLPSAGITVFASPIPNYGAY